MPAPGDIEVVTPLEFLTCVDPYDSRMEWSFLHLLWVKKNYPVFVWRNHIPDYNGSTTTDYTDSRYAMHGAEVKNPLRVTNLDAYTEAYWDWDKKHAEHDALQYWRNIKHTLPAVDVEKLLALETICNL